MRAASRRGNGSRAYRAGAGACLLALAAHTGADALAQVETVAAGDGHGPHLDRHGSQYGLAFGASVRFDYSDYRDDESFPMEDGTNLRRAQLRAVARLPAPWSARVVYDFSRDGIEGLRDAFVRYQGEQSPRITAGHFKQPFGMERLSSVSDLPFMERSLASALTPPRATGAEAQIRGDNWTFSTGGFGRGPEGSDTNIGKGVAGRATFAPMQEAGRILHLGAGVLHRWTDEDKSLRFRQRPESGTTDSRLIDTGVIHADSFTYFGTELAAARGPVAFQTEFISAHVNRRGDDDLRFHGWYMQSSWFITGEPQVYDRGKGTFARMRPARNPGDGPGAWQLAVRLSQLDLRDRNVSGGRQTDWTCTLSWYVNSAVRLNAEYIQVDIEGGRFDGATPKVLQARIQLEL